MATFAVVVSIGTVLLVGAIWLLGAVGAPTWLRVLMWLVPTVVVAIWVLAAPLPAVATDSDDDSWISYSIQFVLVGEQQSRPPAVRLAAAALFGAPVTWSLVVFGLGIVVGFS